MKSLAKCLLLVFASVVPQVASAQEAPAVVPVNPVVPTSTRVDATEKGFAITPPEGWEVKRNVGNIELLMQVPKEPGMVYQRTVQVMVFDGAKFIDDATAKEFESTLVRKFSESSTAIEDFRIRNNTNIEMADGRKGLLFYSEFKIDGVPLMQAHILVSSATRHYLTTYTDLAEHFEKEENQAFLTEAWAAMTSIELDSATPGRFDGPLTVVVFLALFSVVAAAIMFARYRNAKKKYDAIAAADPTTDNLVSASGAQTINSGISLITDGPDDDLNSDSPASDAATSTAQNSQLGGSSNIIPIPTMTDDFASSHSGKSLNGKALTDDSTPLRRLG